jgi:hypothetical protein
MPDMPHMCDDVAYKTRLYDCAWIPYDAASARPQYGLLNDSGDGSVRSFLHEQAAA